MYLADGTRVWVPASSVGGASGSSASSGSSTTSSCSPYDSSCAYCGAHPTSSVCPPPVSASAAGPPLTLGIAAAAEYFAASGAPPLLACAPAPEQNGTDLCSGPGGQVASGARTGAAPSPSQDTQAGLPISSGSTLVVGGVGPGAPGAVTLNINPAEAPDAVGTASRLPFAAGSFSKVAFEFLPFPAFTGDNIGAIAEAARVLTANGTLIIDTGIMAPAATISSESTAPLTAGRRLLPERSLLRPSGHEPRNATRLWRN